MNSENVQYESKIQKLSLQKFEIIGQLGEGSYAEVYEVQNIKTQKMGVLKKLYKDQILDQCKHIEVYIERYMLLNYSKKHPGIVQFQGSFQDEECLYFILELCPYGDLTRIMKQCYKNPSTDSDTLARLYMRQICSVVTFLHSEGIAHLDIKPQNIVIDQNKNIKLIDFATCYFFDESLQPPKLAKELEQAAKLKELKKSQQEGFFRSSFVGSPEYVSPEMLEHSRASKEADLWAIGCLIYQFYYGKAPFDAKSENAVFQKITSLDFCLDDPLNHIIPPDVKDIISKLLVTNPKDRCGALDINQLFDHAFFDSVKTIQLWKQPLIIPPKCVDYFVIKTTQPLCSMTNFFNLKQSEPSCNRNHKLTSLSPSITESSPSEKKHQQEIELPRDSDESTNVNTSSSSARVKSLPHCIILLRGSWFWQFPKAHILLLDSKRMRLVLNDFKKQKYLPIDEKTEVKLSGQLYTIERKGDYFLKFENNQGNLDWCQLINDLKSQ